MNTLKFIFQHLAFATFSLLLAIIGTLLLPLYLSYIFISNIKCVDPFELILGWYIENGWTSTFPVSTETKEVIKHLENK